MFRRNKAMRLEDKLKRAQKDSSAAHQAMVRAAHSDDGREFHSAYTHWQQCLNIENIIKDQIAIRDAGRQLDGAGRDDNAPAYRLILKDHTIYTLARDGAVLARTDGPKGWDYSHGWHIIGFGTRMNSRELITLEDAAAGANIGQGWVHDLDHGTFRMWGSPSGHRAVRIERIEAVAA